jgi:hypothetical protein
MAVIGAVTEFGRALLKPLGAPAGRIESFIEVPFKINGRSIRPDGVITVTRGTKTWSAIICNYLADTDWVVSRREDSKARAFAGKRLPRRRPG